MELEIVEIRTVNFHGDDLVGVKARENETLSAFVPLKHMCDVLGLDMRVQLRKVSDHWVLSKGLRHMTIPSAGGPQKTACLRYDLVPFWLASISISKVRSDLRSRLAVYQEQVADVLADVFLLKGYAVNPYLSDYERQAALMKVQAELDRERRLLVLAESQAEAQRACLSLLGRIQGEIAPTLLAAILANIMGVPVPVVPYPSAKQLSIQFADVLGFVVNPRTLGRIAREAGLFAGIDIPGGRLENPYVMMSTSIVPRTRRPIPQALYKPAGVARLLDACKVALADRKIDPEGQLRLSTLD